MKQATRSVLVIAASIAIGCAPGLISSAQAAAPMKIKAALCDGHKATIVSSHIVISGTRKSDVIVVRGAGAHIVNAGAGNDIICASSSGTTTINGGPGNDILIAGKGKNVLDGNQGKDTFITKQGSSVVHEDVTDAVVRTKSAKVSFHDDSHWDNSAIPQDVRLVLAKAGTYLTAGIIAGDITGQGLQAALPDAPSVGAAPQSTILTNVMWNVTNTNNVINGDTCVEASTDGTLFFKYTGEVRNGDSHGRVTTGKCLTAPGAPQPTTALDGVLKAARDQMFLAISTSTISGTGDQLVLPDVPDVVTPNSAFIKRVLWNVTSNTKANFCVAATDDGSSFFHVEGSVRGDKFRAHFEGGQCEAPKEHGHGPALGADTGTFLLAARDYMNAGIVGGFITGSGDQATFPSGDPDTTAPTFAGLNDVRWQLQSSSVPRGRFCVSALDTNSQKLFRYLGHFEHGQAEGSILPGGCNFADEHPTPGFGSDVVASLMGAAGYLGTEIMVGQLTGTGSQATMPGDASWLLGLFPATPAISHVEWNVTSAPMAPDFAATFCVTASSDGTNLFHVAAQFGGGRELWHGTIASGDCSNVTYPVGGGHGAPGGPSGNPGPRH